MSRGPSVTRRIALGLLVAASMLAPLRSLAQPADNPPPIVFVHGNGDSASEWMVSLWRWESNGYPRDRLFAIDLRNPSARTLDNVPEAGTSSSDDVRDQLADFVDRVLDRTDAKEVVLVGNSRGGNTIRNFLKNAGGAAKTSKAVLGGAVSHGAYNNVLLLPTSEYNSASPFITQLNAGPNEVVPGVDVLTLRSDRFDKFAQPDARFIIGVPIPTNISYDAPALTGAKNLVLPGLDHRETAMHRTAFAAAYTFITGEEPERLSVAAEDRPLISGVVTGVTAGLYDNRPVEGAQLSIFRVNKQTGERLSRRAYHVKTDGSGRWGPFAADPDAAYEFLLKMPGQPVTHVYRSPFPRGSGIVNVRPAATVKDLDKGSVVVLDRPSGYFGINDTLLFDGVRPAISTDPVPNVATTTLRTPFERVSHTARFNDEVIAARNWPRGHVAIVQFND